MKIEQVILIISGLLIALNIIVFHQGSEIAKLNEAVFPSVQSGKLIISNSPFIIEHGLSEYEDFKKANP